MIARLTSKKGSGTRKLIDLKLSEGVITVRERGSGASVAEGEGQRQLRQPSPPAPLRRLRCCGERGAGSCNVVAVVDLQSAIVRSLPVGEEELFAEISASLREPKVEQRSLPSCAGTCPMVHKPGSGAVRSKLRSRRCRWRSSLRGCLRWRGGGMSRESLRSLRMSRPCRLRGTAAGCSIRNPASRSATGPEMRLILNRSLGG